MRAIDQHHHELWKALAAIHDVLSELIDDEDAARIVKLRQSVLRLEQITFVLTGKQPEL